MRINEVPEEDTLTRSLEEEEEDEIHSLQRGDQQQDLGAMLTEQFDQAGLAATLKRKMTLK